MWLYQLTLMRLIIDCAYSPQSYHCVSNERGPASANPFYPPAMPDRSIPSFPPIDATFPISLIADRQFTSPASADASVRSAGIREEPSRLDCATGEPSLGATEAVVAPASLAGSVAGAGVEPMGGLNRPRPSPGRLVGFSPVGSGADARRFASEKGAVMGALSTSGPGASTNSRGLLRMSSTNRMAGSSWRISGAAVCARMKRIRRAA